MKLTVTPAPLVPSLSDMHRARLKHDPAAGFYDSDLVHVITKCLGLRAGTCLPVLGYVTCYDVTGEVYAVRLYVPGRQTTAAGRAALRFPDAIQTEVLFAALPPFITELDLTDYGHCLALSRVHEAVVVPMYPNTHSLKVAA